MNKMRNSILVKVIGLVCTLALVLGAIYVPVTMSAFAATIPVTPDETMTFSFEPAEDPAINNGSYKDRAEDGFGLASWGMQVQSVDGAKVIGRNWGSTLTYVQGGGYRLNNKDGVYRLDTSSRYVVRFKLSLRSAPTPETVAEMKTNAYINLGYGFTGGPASSTGNQVKTMGVTVLKVAESSGNVYALTDISGTREVTPSDKWYDLTYVFTTPASFGTNNNSFGFWAMNVPGTEFYIDEVQVTKLGSTTGIVLANDPYNAETTVMMGKVGDNVELPTLVGKEETHQFLGWFTDEDRTVPATDLKYAEEAQTAYAKWRAPVTLTFKDTLNNTEVPVNGYTGDAIAFPKDPVDTVNNPAKYLFAGWYTTEMFTQKYEATEFGSSDITVYAKWQEKESEFVEDFENYTYSDKVANAPDSNGRVFYKNYHYFATQMEKIDDPTNSGKGKVVKFEWDSTMTKVNDDPDTYNAAAELSNRTSGCITMGNHKFVDGMQYIMYFDYYVEEIGSQTITMTTQNINYSWGWTFGDALATKTHGVTVADKDGKWHTGVVVLTMKEKSGVGPYIHALFRNSKNENAKVYLDNFRFVPVQINEVVMTVNNGMVAPTEYVPVVKGAALDIPVPTVEGRTFKGWYSDDKYVTKFTDEVAPDYNFTVYSRWNDVPMDFQTYPYSTTNEAIFGRSISIVKEEGVGVNDDAVLKFEIDGDQIYSTDANGNPVYWASRMGTDMPGHIAKIGEVQEGEVYKVSFWYKGDPAANKESWVRFSTAHPSSIWVNAQADNATAKTIKPSDDWTKVEFLYQPKLKDPTSTGLYLRFASMGATNNLDLHAIAYVDDIIIEKIDKPFVIFDGQNSKQGIIVQGKVGEEIKAPATPKLVGMKFLGWYTDKEFTQPFTQTVFEDGIGVTVYAKYDYADSFTVSFENVGKNRGKEDDYLFYRGGMGAVEKVGYNKSTGLLFDRTETSDWSSTNALFEDGSQVIISAENKYYVTFKYCVTEQQKDNGFVYLRAASPGNGWGFKHSLNKTFENAGVISIDYPVPATAEVGRWYTAAVILDTSKIYVHTNDDGTKGDPKAYAAVYMYYRGGAGKIAIDDVSFKKLPKGHQAYIVDNGGAKSVPSYVSGPIGTSFRRQLPTNPQFENHIFKNYFRYDSTHNQAVLEDKDMVFTKDNLNLVTNWVRLHTVQDFEDFGTLMYTYPGFGPADFDYELYDAKKEGNSADNVTSGRYSIHRLGNSAYFENIQILPDDLRICADEKFTVTMKVKIGKHFHTDGAIKVVGCKSSTYAWTNTGSFHPIAVIADIADGEWHEVSYTFSSVERYLAIQTPGYVEVFIDDVVIDRADPEMPVSTPPVYTEYVQALRDKDGNLIKVDTTSIDVGSIIDFSLYIGGFNVGTLLIIIGGVVLVAAAVFVVLFVIKKRKAKKA